MLELNVLESSADCILDEMSAWRCTIAEVKGGHAERGVVIKTPSVPERVDIERPHPDERRHPAAQWTA